MKLNIALIYGGKSMEHEVSVISALQAKSAFDDNYYNVRLVYLGKDNQFYIGEGLENLKNYIHNEQLKKSCDLVHLYKEGTQWYFKKENRFKKYPFDLAFLLVHGRGVEDGTLQALFSFHDIPFVGVNQTCAALSQDKVLSKMVLEANQLSVVPYFWFYKEELDRDDAEIRRKAQDLGYPLVVKAATLGSSIGVYLVHNEEEYLKALVTVANLDDKILVEKAIMKNREINCALFKEKEEIVVSQLEEVFKQSEILSFDDKYQPQEKAQDKRVIPAQVDPDLEKEIYTLAKASYRLLNNESIARIDFLIDTETKTLYFNEINTVPGSLAFYLYEKIGLIYPKLLSKLIDQALYLYQSRQQLIFSHDTTLYSSLVSKGSKFLK